MTSRSPAGQATPISSPADERGQTALMIIGFTVVLAMAFVLVVDATAAFLRRQALSTLADGAALAAVDGIAGERLYTRGVGDQVVVDPRSAAVEVSQHLAAVGAHARYPGLRHHVQVRGSRVVVRVAAPLTLPLPLPGVDRTTRVTAIAAAVADVRD